MKENWTYKKLGEVAYFSRGLTFAKSDVVDTSSKTVLRSNNIDLVSHSLNYDDVACLKEDFIIPDEKKLHKGDIFICMSNGSTQHLGKVAFIEDDIDFAFGGFMGAIHPDVKLVYPKFAFYSCLSTEYRRFLASILNGVNINNLKWSELSKFTIPVPPIETQSRIVSELDLLQSIIDKQKAQLKELDNLAQAVFYDMFGDPVENEKGWEVKKVSEITKYYNGIAHEQDVDENGTFILVNAKFISSQGEIVKRTSMQRFPLIVDDIVMVLSDLPNGKSLGKCFLVDKNNLYLLNQRICCFRGFNGEAIFLKFVINRNPYFLSFDDGKGQTNLRKNDVENLPVILPPLSLQQSFAAKIASIEKQKAAIGKSIEETQKLFDYTMDKYFG